MLAQYMLPSYVSLSVRPSVCLTHSGTVPKRLNVGLKDYAISAVWRDYTLWFTKLPPYSHDCSFYKCWLISTIFVTWCTELICSITDIDLPTSPAYCCYTTLGNINCCIVLSSKGLTSQSHLWMHETLCPPYLCQLVFE